MRITRARTVVSVAVGLSLAVAACGGSDEASDTSSPATEAQDTTDTESTPDTEAPTETEAAAATDAPAETEAEPASTDAAASGTGCDAVDLSAAPDSPVTIRMGHGAGTEEPLYIMAVDPEGANSQYNGTHYTLELTEYAPPDRLAAYQAGAMDGGTISAPQLFTAVNGGLDIMAAASIAIVAEDNGFLYPYAAVEGELGPGDSIEGKIIGIIAPNTATEYWAKSYAASLGLDPNRDVSYVPVPVPNAEQTVRDGQVDAQMFTSSFWVLAQNEGGLVEVFNALSGPGFDHEFLDIFFDRQFVTDNEVAYCAWRADYAASMAAFVADRAAFAQPLIDGGYDPAPSAEAFIGREDAGRSADAAINVDNLQLLIDDMKSIEFLAPDVTVTADQLLMDGYSLVK